MQIEAVYQAGVLRPLQPLNLLEGSKIQIILVEETAKIIPSKAATMLQLIADLPEEGDAKPFSGEDHDSVLYPSSENI